ncbi:hypothetical protein MANES_13G150400v8 [Manihot esculenta]|uniref:Uncharacterized protein n=1 Tax=Manihot esculenta TaxID=3983 RepID=A0ACB7GPR5_MANES|nr:hypothetical protein MANES_13G150400v8 [Manihot esculenta]
MYKYAPTSKQLSTQGDRFLHYSMVCFCFLVDQTRKVRRSKPAAGTCSRCGGGASVADMKTSTRFCCVPFYCLF